MILIVLIALLPGCRTARIPAPYTEQELRVRCEQQGGWWHADDLYGPFCEYQSPGMI